MPLGTSFVSYSGLDYCSIQANTLKTVDPRDNPVKPPYQYHPAAVAEQQIPGTTHHIAEPYASVKHQLAVAFTEAFPGNHLLIFYNTLKIFERDFAPRSDLSAAERKWATERSLWSYFCEFLHAPKPELVYSEHHRGGS
jgi:hypothetical protein